LVRDLRLSRSFFSTPLKKLPARKIPADLLRNT
jgi:hypothetical protein